EPLATRLSPQPRLCRARVHRMRWSCDRNQSAPNLARRRNRPSCMSKQRQPFPGLLFADRRGFQSSTDARVPFQIDGGQTGISLVQNLRQHGVASLELLEAPFVGAAAKEQPISSGIPDAIAGKNIETETELIDEVIHVALIAAVIVAEKTQPLGTP